MEMGKILKFVVAIFASFFINCASISHANKKTDDSVIDGKIEQAYEPVLMRIHVGDKTFLGFDPKYMGSKRPDRNYETIKIGAGQKFRLRVELLLKNGNTIGVKNDKKTVYRSPGSIINIVDEKYVVGNKLNKRDMDDLNAGLTVSAHLAIYHNIVDDMGRVLENPSGLYAGGLVWFSAVAE